MGALIETILVLIQGMMGELGSNATVAMIDKIIAALVQIVPIITANFANFLAPIENIIANLENNGVVTQAQLQQLDALSQQVDAAFESAAAAAGDPAPGASS